MPPEIQQPPKSHVNLKALLVTLFLLAVAVFLSYRFLSPAYYPPFTAGISSIKQMQGNSVPSDMPKDIILAKDAEIVSSYTGITPQGLKQSTLIFTSASSTFPEYLTYLAKNNWQLSLGKLPTSSTTKITSMKVNELNATKNNQTITINFQLSSTEVKIITSINLLTSQNSQ